jgi:hypothetical protein
MVDAPWLSPRENSGAFFIFSHWALVISWWLVVGGWWLVVGGWSLVVGRC